MSTIPRGIQKPYIILVIENGTCSIAPTDRKLYGSALNVLINMEDAATQIFQGRLKFNPRCNESNEELLESLHNHAKIVKLKYDQSTKPNPSHQKQMLAILARMEDRFTRPLATLFPRLPYDLNKYISEYLNLFDLGRVAKVNRRGNNIASIRIKEIVESLGGKPDSLPLVVNEFLKGLFQEMRSLKESPLLPRVLFFRTTLIRTQEPLCIPNVLENLQRYFRNFDTIKLFAFFSSSLMYPNHIKQLSELPFIKVSRFLLKAQMPVPNEVIVQHPTTTQMGSLALQKATLQGDAAAVERLLNYKADPRNVLINEKSLLHYAAAQGLLEIVALLVKHGFPVDQSGSHALTPLFSALESKVDNKAVIQFLIEHHANLVHLNINGECALHVAVTAGNPVNVRTLLVLATTAGVSLVNNRTLPGETPLHYACRSTGDTTEMLELLLEFQADPRLLDNQSNNCLHWAARIGHAKKLAYLLKINAVHLLINTRGDRGLTPLCCACLPNGNPNAVRVLLDADADPNIAADNHNLPLHMSVLAESLKSVCYLLYKGSLLDVQGVRGKTALHFTLTKLTPTSLAIATLLLQYRADPNVVCNALKTPLDELGSFTKNHSLFRHFHSILLKFNAKKRTELPVKEAQFKKEASNDTKKFATPLHKACSTQQDQPDTVKTLIAQQDVFARDSEGDNALHCAARNGLSESIHVLVESYPKLDLPPNLTLSLPINYLGFYSRTALMNACDAAKENVAIVRYLIEHQADPCITNGYGNMALHLAAYAGYADTVAVLLKIPKVLDNINHRGKNGLTPLCYACSQNFGDPARKNRQVVELLLDHQADISIPTNDKDLPLHVAAANGSVDLVALLLLRGAKIHAQGNKGLTAKQVAMQGDLSPEKKAVVTLLEEFGV